MNMTLRSILVFGSLWAVAPPAQAQDDTDRRVIRNIEVKGLKRLSGPAIMAKMRIRIGDEVTRAEVREEAGNLYRLGEFSMVEDEVVQVGEEYEVIFTVVEKPLVAEVRFVARDTDSGEPSISRKDLLEAVTTTSRGRFSEYLVRVDMERIRDKYNEKGYAFAEVSWDPEEVPGGLAVIFSIDEGPRLRIYDIGFVGNHSIDSGVLLKVMETTTKSFFFGIPDPGYYDESVLSRDVERLRNFYRGKGFHEARVSVEDLKFDSYIERMGLTIRVEEGPRYRFRGYHIQGNRVFSNSVLERLTRAPANQPYDEEKIQEDRAAILDYYRDRAYIYASVIPRFEYDQEGTDVWVRLDISEGNEIVIEHVRILKVELREGRLEPVPGLKTQDRVIRRELEFYPGEKINDSKLEKSRSNLSRLQIFQEVIIEPDPGPGSSPGKKDVLVEILEEDRTGSLTIGFGVTSGFGLIGNFSILKRNFDIMDWPDSLYDVPDSFTGAGQTLNIVIQPGTLRSLYRGTFVEPYLFDTRNALSLSGSLISIDRDDYEERRKSFVPRIAHAFDFDRDLVFSVSARIEEVKITNIQPNASPDVFAVRGTTPIISVGSGLNYDKLLYDRWEGPYSGHRINVKYEYGGEPLGGDVDFYRIDTSLSLYYPIYVTEAGHHHVVSFFSKGGVVRGHHENESIPIFERFFLGGPNTVRGFRFRGLGPHFNNEAQGGSTAWYGNAEYAIPLFQAYLRGVFFVDYGNLAPDMSSFELDRMRYTVGAGIRINFPFLGRPLPIGLYYGKAVKSEDEDRLRDFSFTIGAPF